MGQPRLHSFGKPRNPPHRAAPPVGRVGQPPRGRVPTPTRRKNAVGAGFAASGSCRKPLAPLPHCPETYTPPGTEHTHTSAVCVPLSLGGSSRRVGQVGQEQKRKVKVKRKSFGKPSASLLALPHSFAPPGSSRWVSGARQPTLFGCASAESSLRSATLLPSPWPVGFGPAPASRPLRRPRRRALPEQLQLLVAMLPCNPKNCNG